MNEKNMKLALIISSLFPGMGIAYAWDVKRGVLIFAISLIFNALAFYINSLYGIPWLIIWILGLYLTYVEIRAIYGY